MRTLIALLAALLVASSAAADPSDPRPRRPEEPSTEPAPVAARPVGAADPAPDPPRLDTIEALRAGIAEVLERTGAPGVGLAIVRGDGVRFAGGVGVASRETGEAVSADTIFRIGSITKSFVALTALMLVEEGVLDLDAPLREVAPEIEFENPWEATDPVRIVHLLEHTTGWDDLAPRDYVSTADAAVSLREALDANPTTRHSRWPPGTSMAYCNSGPAVAAYVIAKVTGRAFEDIVRERIFAPLGMTHADFVRSDAVAERLAQGYAGTRAVSYWNIAVRPSGAINASALEMAPFVQMLLNRGRVGDRTLVSPQAIDRMETSRTTRAARAGVRAGYGLNSYTTVHRGIVLHGHNGGMPGYLAEMAYAPGYDIGYVYLLNASDARAMREIGRLVRDFVTAGLEPPPPPPAAAVEPSVLAGYAGWYEPITPRVERGRFVERILGVVRVDARGDRLRLAPLLGPARTLVPVSDPLFRFEDEPLSSVAFYGGELHGLAHLGMGLEAHRIPALLFWIQLVVGAFSLAALASALPFALIWGPRRLFGKRRVAAGELRVRALPALAAALLGTALGIAAWFSADAAALGRPTVWSVSVWLLMWLFAATSFLGLVQVLRQWSHPTGSSVRLHSLAASLGASTVALYLLYWGVIGWRPWA